jgi:RNA polymerase sigma-70 factor (ECF subfamily)
MLKSSISENKTDEELAGLVSANPDFYYPLMKRYEEKILRYIRRIAGVTRETAEDLGQEIFLKAYENIEDFDRSLKFSSWLYRIARNHVISFWRRDRRRGSALSLDEYDNLKDVLESEFDTARELDRKITMEKLNFALGMIKPAYREVLVLKYLEDKDYQEISDILRRPTGTVGTLIARAKKELKITMAKNNIRT